MFKSFELYLIEFNIDLIVLEVYSILSFSKILVLLCVSILTLAQVRIIISNDLAGLVILTIPKGRFIEFFPKELTWSLIFLSKVTILKVF